MVIAALHWRFLRLKMFKNDTGNTGKQILTSFIAAATLIASSVVHPMSLWQLLDAYGFSRSEQKQAIVYLLEQSGVQEADVWLHTSHKTPDELLANIIKFLEITQKNFTIRTGVQERWDIDPAQWMMVKENQQDILVALTALGLTNAVAPTFKQRDVICILGARNSAMQTRLAYAGGLYANRELPAAELVLLAGERYVTFDKEHISIDGTEVELSTLAKKIGKSDVKEITETDLIYEAYIHSELFGKMPVTVIDTPRGNLPRPTTETTIIELIRWLRKHPEVRSITFVSNQPHVEYQKAVIEMVFKRENMDTKIEVIGPEFKLAADKDRATYIKDLVAALGSQIYAVTPGIVEKLDLDVDDPSLKARFIELYKKQPLIYNSVKAYYLNV